MTHSRNFGVSINEEKNHLRKSIILVSIISKVSLYHSERVTSFKGELFLYYTNSADDIAEDNCSGSDSDDSEAGERELF